MSKNLDDCKILDATCGSRTIWFTKDNPNCLYIDKRVEHGTRIWKSTKNDSERRIDVEPDIVADFTQLPFPDKSFYLVVFDPPHLVKIGENAWLKKKYGKLPEMEASHTRRIQRVYEGIKTEWCANLQVV